MKRLVICICILVSLMGCSNHPSLDGYNQVSDMDASDSSIDGTGQAVEEEAELSEDNPAFATMSERIKMSGLDIPEQYIPIIEAETNIGAEYGFGEIAYLSYGPFDVIHLFVDLGYHGQYEYHVFENGNYMGRIDYSNAKRSEERFQAYQNHVWMVVDLYAGHGMGGPSFSRTRQVWYEISHPDLPVALSFISRLDGGWMYPGQSTNYTAEIIEADEHDGIYTMVLEWDEQITPGILPPDGVGHDTVLFAEKGTVSYQYAEEGNYFYQPEKGVPSGSLTFSTEDSHEVSVVSNQAYEDPNTLYGRDKYNFLITYSHKMLELTETGNDIQKQWLHDFLDSLEPLDNISGLYVWNQEYED